MIVVGAFIGAFAFFTLGWYRGMMSTERQHAQWIMEAFHDDKAAFIKFMNVPLRNMKLKPETERSYKDLFDKMGETK